MTPLSGTLLGPAGLLGGAANGAAAAETLAAEPGPGPIAEALAVAGSTSMVSAAQGMAQEFRLRLFERLAAIPQTLAETQAILAVNSPTGTPGFFLFLIAATLGLLLFGYAAARLLVHRPFLRPLYARRLERGPEGRCERLPVLVMRAAMGLVTLVLSLLIAALIAGAVFPGPANAAAEKTVLITAGAWVAGFVLVLMWRLVLAPNLGAYRLPAMSDAHARRLFRWLAPGSVFAVAIEAYCMWMSELGLSEDVHAVTYSGMTLVAVGITVATLVVNRQAISGAFLCGGDCAQVAGPLRLVTTLWAPAAVFYLVAGWIDVTYREIMGNEIGMPPVLGFYLVVLVILAVQGVLTFGVDRFFTARQRRARAAIPAAAHPVLRPQILPDAAGAGSDRPVAGARVESYEDLAKRVAGILAGVAGAAVLIRIWDMQTLPALGLALSQGMALLSVGLVGYVAYEAARIAIDNRIDREGGLPTAAAPGDEGGAAGASRLATLLPLIRVAVLGFIATVAGAMLLMELGVNLTPLFAGAGVIGIAIGFGAQYLIRDILAGLFFLIDDAFRHGEYIEVGEVKGTVENISIRSFQLRHHLGPLQTIPFGEIKTMTNYSRDWVIMKLPLRVTYDTDVERVRKLVKQLGQQLLEDPDIGDQFLQPLKSQGVVEMQDSAMIIRVKFTTKPGDQWLIRQRVYNEVRELFQREGIRFAHREVTVRVADEGAPMSPARRDAITAAALDLDAEDMPPRRPAAVR